MQSAGDARGAVPAEQRTHVVSECAVDSLAFSVTLFCSEAALVVLVLLLRRRRSVGGELGGPRALKLLTSGFFFSLWLLYLLMSGLEAYDVIKGF
ncbi:Sodium/calcium exchanger 1 [Papilio machaon]|uniref:Sodium/calcium exchanger 1 n=1 Tax=Papilio machaon TaxID=76193 RepID=A0A194RLD2_PAPMA|nr:Sodium/calcium exchanger 1 [Papilio machaon]